MNSKKSEPRLIEAGLEWADRYREFCQKVYQATYVQEDLGILPELFSKESFTTPSTIGYFKDLFSGDGKQWLLIDDNEKIIGGIVATKKSDYCEMKGLYIDPDYQGRGYGKQLFLKVLEFAGNQPIRIEVIQYMQKTFDLYKRWGFVVDPTIEPVRYSIDGWPENALEQYQGIVMIRQPGSL